MGEKNLAGDGITGRVNYPSSGTDGLKDNVRETKKCFICGPVLDSGSEAKTNLTRYLDNLAEEVGGGKVEEMKTMSSEFLFEDFVQEGYRAYAATMNFDNYMGAVKMVNEYRYFLGYFISNSLKYHRLGICHR